MKVTSDKKTHSVVSVTKNVDYLNNQRSARVPPPDFLTRFVKGSGIRFNGFNAHDVQVFDKAFYQQIVCRGVLGFGEAYMDNLWDTERLDVLFDCLLRAGIDKKIKRAPFFRLLLRSLYYRVLNLFINYQSRQRALHVIEKHYDIGNELYSAMLDSSMSYSCGYWANASNLEEAQHDKMDMICKKLKLNPGDRLLDIGCGWGGLAHYAAKHYAVEVIGVTLSHQQQMVASNRCKGLPVHIKLMDYRDIDGTFDKVVSVGMCEHIGPKNYRSFMETVDKRLSNNGIFLLHTIGNNETNAHEANPWIRKYIFPNGQIPTAIQLTHALSERFNIRDWHEFGVDYYQTLMAWWHNFDRAWPGLSKHYDERFYRMWKYYLQSCAGCFRSGNRQVWQIVLTKKEFFQEYQSIRP